MCPCQRGFDDARHVCDLNVPRINTLRRQLATAQDAVHARERLLAAAAHDLQQPAEAIRLYARLLQAEPARAVELAGRIEHAAGSMKDVVRSLLDLALLDARGGRLAHELVDVGVLLDDLRSVYEPLARQKGLALRLRPMDATLQSTPVLLRRILGNLLANAIRYTERGGVLLAARRRAGGLSLEVWDTGIGIDPAAQQRVFEALYRAAPVGVGTGMGLGLTIASELAARLGGRVSVGSRLGRGSVFRLVIGPAVRAGEPDARPGCDS